MALTFHEYDLSDAPAVVHWRPLRAELAEAARAKVTDVEAEVTCQGCLAWLRDHGPSVPCGTCGAPLTVDAATRTVVVSRVRVATYDGFKSACSSECFLKLLARQDLCQVREVEHAAKAGLS